MIIEKDTLSIVERTELDNARALKEKVETQSLLIQYVADMTGIYIANEEGSDENVQHIEETEK